MTGPVGPARSVSPGRGRLGPDGPHPPTTGSQNGARLDGRRPTRREPLCFGLPCPRPFAQAPGTFQSAYHPCRFRCAMPPRVFSLLDCRGPFVFVDRGESAVGEVDSLPEEALGNRAVAARRPAPSDQAKRGARPHSRTGETSGADDRFKEFPQHAFGFQSLAFLFKRMMGRSLMWTQRERTGVRLPTRRVARFRLARRIRFLLSWFSCSVEGGSRRNQPPLGSLLFSRDQIPRS